MKTYTDKAELVKEIKNRYQKYIDEFEEIPEGLRDKRVETVDRTPSENLSYQLGWLSLLLDWEATEQQDLKVFTPAKGYKWNNLGGLYQSFYNEYGKLTLFEQKECLDKKVVDLCIWIESLSEKELFEPGYRQWATTNAQWPIYKWVHINTVAPFTNFRTKIRKWKKLAL
ncbi:ClbS/DfsB family four-helix bundle protein (plasmid) [Latilactobacillus sp. 5-91]|uniref:ClbS/DfsB family four-helix bundle protein n=1 Tax=Latilactobacillus sp. 5-91 TaxID=3410924 RepID=UPI003C712CB9